jgi:putative DNA primase/helicase
LIGAFNQHCDDLSIHAAVAEYLSDVLEPLDDEKHFNLIGHAGRGVFITDDGKHLCGNHDSWVGGSNRAMNMWDVVRHFKFDGPADDALEPFGQRASDRAMTEWAGAQHLVAEIQDRRVAIAMSAALDLGSVESMVAEHGTEHAVALAFTMRYDGVVKFDYQSGSWLQYTGTHWSKQTTGLVSHYCRQMAASLGKKCQRSGFISGVEKLAKTDPRMASDSAFFDHDNYLFNCPDGTYDLRDGTRREHRPSDLLTNIAEVAPAAPGDYGERFPQFLNEVTQGETEMATFLQVSLGACLSGALENHHLMFLIGNGRNGKNTLGDLVMEVMGSYARKIPNNVLMKSKNERHPAEIADLKGARLVVASEIDQGAHWDEARINELTGDTRIKARFMHGNPFEFNRTFKILIYGNHRPRLQSATDAMRSRLKIVRFGASFLGREDPDLPAKLRSERGNVLRWLLDGHKMWIDAGKKLPDFAAMREELEDYVDAQGTIKNWIDETLLIIGLGDGGPWLKARDGYHFYQVWKEARGETSFSMTVWGEEMSKHFQKKKARDGNFYSARLISPGDSLLQ